MGDIAALFAEKGDHPAIGKADLDVYLQNVIEQFGNDEVSRPFVIEQYEKVVVFNYGSESRFEIVPILGQLAQKCGLNATEF